MKYDTARPLIKTGDLLAFTHKGWSSFYALQIQVVRMFTRSEYSHVGIAYVAHDRVFVLEAVSQEVRLFPLSRSLPFYWIQNPKPLGERALEWAFEQLGLEYESKLDMVLNVFINRNLNKNQRFQCSEYVNGILIENNQEPSHDEPTAVVETAMRLWGSLQYVEAD